MKVRCAWCQREGASGVLIERPPFEDPSETHGICAYHSERTLAKLPSDSFPGIQLLLVVSAREIKLYQHLSSVLSGVSGATVIQDRRRADRRQRNEPVAVERRRGPRRLRRGSTSGFGYTSIRFNESTPSDKAGATRGRRAVSA